MPTLLKPIVQVSATLFLSNKLLLEIRYSSNVAVVIKINSAYQNGELSISQRRGVISLIQKKDSSLLKLEDWRPITLLNVDYKIASKAIAKRIEPLLSFLVL